MALVRRAPLLQEHLWAEKAQIIRSMWTWIHWRHECIFKQESDAGPNGSGKAAFFNSEIWEWSGQLCQGTKKKDEKWVKKLLHLLHHFTDEWTINSDLQSKPNASRAPEVSIPNALPPSCIGPRRCAQRCTKCCQCCPYFAKKWRNMGWTWEHNMLHKIHKIWICRLDATQVAKPQHGHWQLAVRNIRVGVWSLGK